MKLFRALFIIDAVVAAVIGVIFCFGLVDAISARHVDLDDVLLWPLLLAGIAGVFAGSLWLRSRHRLVAANAVLLAMAVPGLLGGLLVLVVIGAMLQPGAMR